MAHWTPSFILLTACVSWHHGCINNTKSPIKTPKHTKVLNPGAVMILKGQTNTVSLVFLLAFLSFSSGLLVEVRERWRGLVKAAYSVPSKVNLWAWLVINLPSPKWGCGHHWPGVLSLSLFVSMSPSQPSAFLTFLYIDWFTLGPASAAPASPHESMSCLCVNNNIPMYMDLSNGQPYHREWFSSSPCCTCVAVFKLHS